MTDKMTVAIAAGGTAGHINPALALAEELRDRGHHVVFVGQSRKLEGRLVPEAGFDFVPITVTGFDRSRPWTALTSLWRVNKAKRALASHFSKVGNPMPLSALVLTLRSRCWAGARAPAFRICCTSRTLFRVWPIR